ncbi:MAG: DegT/DnrJ/EryC1/StrS family aminotransferase [Caulobacteraceae bacterium]
MTTDSPPSVQAFAHSRIPVYQPDLSGAERRYVLECMDSGWISSLGVFIERFESALAVAAGARHAIAVSNGTVALHLALHCLGIGPGDEVIVPTFTFIASVNTIAQTGATPVFVDSCARDWLLDIEDVRRNVTKRTKAIVPVHLYGAVCDMAALLALADDHGLKIVEDCAEALGAKIGEKHVGTFGDVGTYSFFGNKTVTTGEGGALITNDDVLAARLRQTKGQGQSLNRRYWHETLGFNYRMTNIAAAIGCAQMERLPQILERKREISEIYRGLLADFPISLQGRGRDVHSSEWLFTVLLPRGCDRDTVILAMERQYIDTRPVFYCAHRMPYFVAAGLRARTPVADDLSTRGISLPSYPALTRADQERVASALFEAIAEQGFAHNR